MTTNKQVPAKAKRYIVDDEWIAQRDAKVRALAYQEIREQLARELPVHDRAVATSHAQAGANAIVAYLAQRGRLLPAGTPLKIKTVVRDDKGQITAVVDEEVVAQERKAS